MRLRKQFEIWHDKKINMWVASYNRYPGIVGIDETPPRALMTLIFNMEQAQKKGRELSRE